MDILGYKEGCLAIETIDKFIAVSESIQNLNKRLLTSPESIEQVRKAFIEKGVRGGGFIAEDIVSEGKYLERVTKFYKTLQEVLPVIIGGHDDTRMD